MTKEPQYDGGKYCIEFSVEGRWKKKKTGRFLSRTYNHITIHYAMHHLERAYLEGNYVRVVYEPTNRVVTETDIWARVGWPLWLAWKRWLDNEVEAVRNREGNR